MLPLIGALAAEVALSAARGLGPASAVLPLRPPDMPVLTLRVSDESLAVHISLVRIDLNFGR